MIVQGAVNPDEFYVQQADAGKGAAGDRAARLGLQARKDGIREIAEAGRSTRVVETGADERRALLPHGPRSAGARTLCALPSSGTTGGRWISSGPRTVPTAKLYVLQARPETVKSRKRDVEERYALKGSSRVLASGRAIGHKIGSGAVRVVPDASQMAKVKQGDVLVTDMTDPNWEPVMKLAAAIVTNRGGRTCHAAIIARELGIPAVVGCGDATARLKDGQPVTVSCAEGDTGSGSRVVAVRSLQPRARRDAAHRGQDRDERRQSGSWRSNSRNCPTRASASAPRIHHQQRDRRAPRACLESLICLPH